MDDVEIRFSGSGGQGLILSAKILAAALVEEGNNVAQSQSYEPVSRGGLSRSDLVVTKGEAAYPLSSGLDFLMILDGAAANASDGLLNKDSLVLVDAELVPNPPVGDFTIKSLPFTETARKLGNKRVANIVALSALVSLSGICAEDTLEEIVKAKTPAKFARLNIEALEAGRKLVG
jgi:2-oxoglutarate ferredoxin oxidoreductase subunit gamma